MEITERKRAANGCPFVCTFNLSEQLRSCSAMNLRKVVIKHASFDNSLPQG